MIIVKGVINILVVFVLVLASPFICGSHTCTCHIRRVGIRVCEV